MTSHLLRKVRGGPGPSFPWLGLTLLVGSCGKVDHDPRPSQDEPRGGSSSGDSSTGGTLDSKGGGGALSSGGANAEAGGAAAGGAVDVASGGEHTGGGAATGGAAAGGMGGEPGTSPTPFDWVTPIELQGMGPGQVWFPADDDASTVVVSGGEYQGLTVTYDRVTGEMVTEEAVKTRVGAIDPSGRLQVAKGGEDCTVFKDGEPEFVVGGSCRELELEFSREGSVLLQRDCGGGGLVMTAWSVESGTVIRQTQTDLPCVYDDAPMIADTGHRRTLFGHPDRDELFVIDWDSGDLDSLSIHEPFDPEAEGQWSHEGTLVELALSPDGGTVASVGAKDGLAWLDAETLEVTARLPEVPFFNAFDGTFVVFISASPIAWSADGEFYATTDAEGGVVVRSTERHGVQVQLAPPMTPQQTPNSGPGYGPVLLAFSPDESQLVALYPNLVVGYSLALP